jgi:hypothetical protein
MSKKLVILFFIVQIGNGLISCSRDNNIVNAGSTDNLLSNPSFEKNGSPSLDSWIQSYQDTSVIHFSSDVPQGGGQYSIKLDVVWGPQFSISSTVNAETGTNIYSFSCMAKVLGVGGTIYLSLEADPSIVRKSIMPADSTWKEYSITDTISSSGGDRIRITLTGGFSQLLPGSTFYDNCKLVKK